MAKKYYWLKLKNDFFNKRELKKLRKIAGGEVYTIIYIRLLLISLENQGNIMYEATENDIYEQLALELDEAIEDIQVTINFLIKNSMAEINKDSDLVLFEAKEMIGCESESAKRVRKHRQKQLKMGISDDKALPCNEDVTNGNTDIDIELEKDKDLDKEKDKEIIKESKKNENETFNLENYLKSNEFLFLPDHFKKSAFEDAVDKFRQSKEYLNMTNKEKMAWEVARFEETNSW